MKLLYDKISFENDRAGIYRIDCIASGKFYIGSSKYLYRRYMDHLSYLRRGEHCNILLQRSYDKYGADNFTYKVLVVLPPEDRGFIYDIEQKFLDAYSPQLNLLNEVGKPIAPSKEIVCYNLSGEFIEKLPSLADAAKKYGAHSTGIRKATMDPWRICAGHRWRYVENGTFEESLADISETLSLATDGNTVSHISWKYSKYTIYQWSKAGELIRTWDSIEEACDSIEGASVRNMREHLRGRINSYYGSVWSLEPEFPGYKRRGENKRKPVLLEKDGEKIEFESMASACRHFGVSTRAFSNIKSRGYTFRGWTIAVLDKADKKPSSEDVEATESAVD